MPSNFLFVSRLRLFTDSCGATAAGPNDVLKEYSLPQTTAAQQLPGFMSHGRRRCHHSVEKQLQGDERFRRVHGKNTLKCQTMNGGW